MVNEQITTISCVCAIAAILFAQEPDTVWTRTYGGTGHDDGHAVVQTDDGGFIVVGRTQSFGAGSYDVILIRTDQNGDTIWTRTYGDIEDDSGIAIQQTYDKGFIVAGTESYGTNSGDVYLIKTDSLGDSLWSRKYGQPGIYEIAYSILQTPDSGYIISADIGNGAAIWLLRTNSNGDTVWTKIYNGKYTESALEIIPTSDSAYVLCGETSSYGAGLSDVYLIKIDTLGDTIWTRTYGGGASDFGYSVKQAPDSGFIIVGSSESFGIGSRNIFLIRTDKYGDTLWTRTYGGAVFSQGHSVQLTADDGYIFAGFTSSYGAGEWDVYVVRTDSAGDLIWTKTIGGTEWDCGWSMKPTDDLGYIICGYTESFGQGGSDVYLIKLEPEQYVEEKNDARRKDSFTATIIRGPLLLPESKWCKVFDITGRTVTPDGVRPGIYFIEIDGEITQKVVKIR